MKKDTAFGASGLLSFCVFALLLLFIFHFSPASAESLSDIKVAALQSPVKERWGRDPFVRPDTRPAKDKTIMEEPPPDLKIDGIISDGKKAMAIISGGFYRKNDRVNDFLIVDIGKDKIVLEKDGRRIPLGIDRFVIEKSQGGGKK